MNNNTSFKIRNNAGNTLHGYKQSPSQYKACILMIHGLNEHGERYRHVADFFNKHKYAFYAYDQTGHGLSDGKRNHASMHGLVEDVEQVRQLIVKKEHANTPIYLFAHSMGGLIALHYDSSYPNNFTKAVLSGPAIQAAFKTPKWKLLLGNIMYKVYPSFTTPTDFNAKAVSRDPVMVKKYVEDELITNTVSAQLGLDILNIGEDILNNASKALSIPTLIMHGSADELTSCDVSKQFATLNSACDFKLWQDAYHELYNEINRNNVMEYALHWLENSP